MSKVEHGHRSTSDDVFGAYVAILEFQEVGRPSSYIDLGTGLSSVLTLVNWAFDNAIPISIGVEAQTSNYMLARKSAALNGLNAEILLGDMREIVLEGQFELVTGNFQTIA